MLLRFHCFCLNTLNTLLQLHIVFDALHTRGTNVGVGRGRQAALQDFNAKKGQGSES